MPKKEKTPSLRQTPRAKVMERLRNAEAEQQYEERFSDMQNRMMELRRKEMDEQHENRLNLQPEGSVDFRNNEINIRLERYRKTRFAQRRCLNNDLQNEAFNYDSKIYNKLHSKISIVSMDVLM